MKPAARMEADLAAVGMVRRQVKPHGALWVFPSEGPPVVSVIVMYLRPDDSAGPVRQAVARVKRLQGGRR